MKKDSRWRVFVDGVAHVLDRKCHSSLSRWCLRNIKELRMPDLTAVSTMPVCSVNTRECGLYIHNFRQQHARYTELFTGSKIIWIILILKQWLDVHDRWSLSNSDLTTGTFESQRQQLNSPFHYNDLECEKGINQEDLLPSEMPVHCQSGVTTPDSNIQTGPPSSFLMHWWWTWQTRQCRRNHRFGV